MRSFHSRSIASFEFLTSELVRGASAPALRTALTRPWLALEEHEVGAPELTAHLRWAADAPWAGRRWPRRARAKMSSSDGHRETAWMAEKRSGHLRAAAGAPGHLPGYDRHVAQLSYQPGA